MNYIALLNNVLAGDGRINEYISCKTNGEVHVVIKAFRDGIVIDFVDNAPIVTIHKMIRITDKLDYVKVLSDNRVFVKVYGWPSEIEAKI